MKPAYNAANRKRIVRHLDRTTHKETLTTETIAEGLRSRMEFEKNHFDRFADFMTRSFGTMWFFVANALFFVFWFLANSGVIGWIKPFDPSPYGVLTMVVSLEAIFLSIIVLISQNRQGKIADIRQQIDFEINVRAEEEITEILVMIDEIRKHLDIRHKSGTDLKQMEKKIDIDSIKKELEEKEQ